MQSKTTRAALWALFTTLVSSHSWVEQMSVLDEQGAYTGQPGYPRGFVPRGDPKFNDDAMTVRFPVTGRTGPNDAANRVVDTDLVCATSQASPSTQNPGYSQLVAGPGNYVALRYLENGHVSMPDNQPGKPGSGGLIYVYGTTNNKVNPKILDVMSWKADSALDTGRLLAINTFDDGRCHQVRNALPNDPPPPWRNNSPQRQKDFPNGGELACETNIQIPKDAKDSLTLYWVWQWPSLPGQKDASGKALGIPEGKDEIYTTCMDVKIGSVQKRTLPNIIPNLIAGNVPAASIPAAGAAQQAAGGASSAGATYKLVGIQNPLITSAVKNFKERAANVTLPTDTAFYGPNSPGGIPRAGAAAGQNQQAPAAPAIPAAQSPKASVAAPVASAVPNNPAYPAVPANTAVPAGIPKASPAIPSAPANPVKSANPAVPAVPASPAKSASPASGGYAGGQAANPSPANAASSPKVSGFYMPAGMGGSNVPNPAVSAAPIVPAVPIAANPVKQVTVMVTVTVTAPAAAVKTPEAAAAGCASAPPIPSALLPLLSAAGLAPASGGASSGGPFVFGSRKHSRFFGKGNAAST